MSQLEVWTTHGPQGGPERLDITRGDRTVFAPSWSILKPAIRARRRVDRLMGDAHALTHSHEGDPYELEAQADLIEAAMWAIFAPAYVAEMRVSYKANREAWEAVRARPRVVVVCSCMDASHCARTLLAGILGKLGANVRGEIP